MLKKHGFTIIEVLISVVLVAILAAIGIVVYTGSQQRAANSAVLSSISHGSEVLEINFAREQDYPPNFAGTEFTHSDEVATALWTNAPGVRSYAPGTLNSNQNTQLFLNACNANMPIEISGQTYNTSCSFAGINIHIKGKKASNVVFHGPAVQQSDLVLTCGSGCTTIMQTIIQQFTDQGGTFPLNVTGEYVSLPEPDSFTSTGNATRYCLEGRSTRYDTVIGHITSEENKPRSGPCALDPELHYP